MGVVPGKRMYEEELSSAGSYSSFTAHSSSSTSEDRSRLSFIFCSYRPAAEVTFTMPGLLNLALPLLASLPSVVNAAGFVAYKDARCTEPLQVLSHSTEVQGGSLDIDVAITDSLRAGHHG